MWVETAEGRVTDQKLDIWGGLSFYLPVTGGGSEPFSPFIFFISFKVKVKSISRI